MADEETKRITVEIPATTHRRLLKSVTWGLRRHLINAILEMILRAIDERGPLVIGAILAGEFSLVIKPAGDAQNLGGEK